MRDFLNLFVAFSHIPDYTMYRAVLPTLACCLITLFADAQTFERYKQPVSITFLSSFSGYGQNIEITLPLEYDEKGALTFPVVVIFDRQDSRNYDYTLRTIDYLTANEQMPSSVIVGIASDPELRYAETQLHISDPAGKGEQTERFLMDELLPQIRANYHGSAFTTLIGQGRYGYFATYLLTRNYPELHAVIAVNPLLEQPNVNLADSLTQLLKKGAASPVTYFRYDCDGRNEQQYATLNGIFGKARNEKANPDAKGQLFSGADSRATSGLYINQALYGIFEFWSATQNTYLDKSVTGLPAAVSRKMTEIEQHYGTPIAFSLGALNGKGWSFYTEGEFEKAIEAWSLLLSYYPDFSEAYLSIAYAEKDLGRPVAATLTEFQKKLSSDTFYTADEKLEMMKECELLMKN